MRNSKNNTLGSEVNYFEDFQLGQRFEHRLGRTINEGDNSLFTSLTMTTNPSYLNSVYSKAQGQEGIIVNHLLSFNVVFGMSVRDLSEAGGAFLEVTNLKFHEYAYPGDTLYAISEVQTKRESKSREHQGIVQWHTKGMNQDDDCILEYKRKNLINKRGNQ